MKRWKTAIGLVVVLFVLGGLATWDEWQTKKDEKTKETENVLLKLKPADIKAFQFYTAGDADTGGDKAPAPVDPAKAVNLRAQLVDGTWKITEPVAATADQQVVQDLLKNITDYKYEREIATGKDQWGQYGLATPRRKVELETNDGSKTTVFVGMNAPVGFSAYVATDKSDQVFAGSQYLATSLAKTLFDFRDKKILGISAADIETTKFHFGTSPVVQLSKQDGKWSITAPEAAEADTTQVNNFLDDIINVKATEFFDSPSKDQKDLFAAGKVFAVFELSGSKTGSTILQVAKSKDGSLLAAKDPNAKVFKIGDEYKTKFAKSLNDFVSKKIFDFQSAQVEQVDADGKVYVRVKDEWYTKDDSAKFDKEGKFTGKDVDKPQAQSHIRGLLVDLEYAKSEAIYGPNDEVVKKLPKSPKNKVILKFAQAANKPDVEIDSWQAGTNPEEIYIRPSTDKSKRVFKAKRSVIAMINPTSALPAEDAQFPSPPNGSAGAPPADGPAGNP